MKNILLIILISISTSSFSQTTIDTSDIKSVRFEWRIDTKTKDSVLTEILTEYQSGIFKEEYPEMDSENSEFGYYHIFDSDNINRNQKTSFDHYSMAIGNGILKTYYDNYKNPDSIVLITNEPKFKGSTTVIKKQYKRKGKLDFITDSEGKNYYKYNLFGKLRQINHYRKDSVLYKISNYKNGLLISEVFPTRKEYRKNYTYEYDKKGRLTKRDDNDYHFYRYEYNDFGIKKIEKIYKKNNRIIEYTLFFYDQNGTLTRKKEFDRNDQLTNEFIYEYKELYTTPAIIYCF